MTFCAHGQRIDVAANDPEARTAQKRTENLPFRPFVRVDGKYIPEFISNDSTWTNLFERSKHHAIVGFGMQFTGNLLNWRLRKSYSRGGVASWLR
jgi:hypothetical protein